jgi:outer membrane protein assembly factor BamD
MHNRQPGPSSTPISLSHRTLVVLTLATVLALGVAGCASSGAVPGGAGPNEADKLLLDRGNEALSSKKFTSARQYFSKLLEGYPQSQYRADAKLGVGDSYLGENNSASYVYAVNEYREFLAFYPTNPRADYAQLQLGMVHLKQMLGPQRDQTETKEAIHEFEVFLERYPNSPLLPQAKERLREAKDRLADGELQVGVFYLKVGLFPAAVPRFKGLLELDPGYTRKDAVYFHLAETLEKSDKKPEALPYYERLVKEFEKSEFLEEAKRRIELLKAQTPAGL